MVLAFIPTFPMRDFVLEMGSGRYWVWAGACMKHSHGRP